VFESFRYVGECIYHINPHGAVVRAGLQECGVLLDLATVILLLFILPLFNQEGLGFSKCS
jgi:hypothetical protein